MKKPIFITGNPHKAAYLAKWLEVEIPHQKLDLDEIQSLDLQRVVEHKVQQAYALVGRPVLVDDVSLAFTAMGRLPGTFIKWYLEELGAEGLCRLADGLATRDAEASIMFGLHTGAEIRYFTVSQKGSIAKAPSGSNGFGWNRVFIPEDTNMTYGDMDDETFRRWNIRARAAKQLRAYLETSDAVDKVS